MSLPRTEFMSLTPLSHLRNLKSIANGERARMSTTEFSAFKTTMETAILESDLLALTTLVQQWKSFLESLPDFLFQEAVRMNPLVAAIRLKRRGVVEFLIKECNIRLDAFHSEPCECRVCQLTSSDYRFNQLYAETIIIAMTSPYYAFCACPESVIDFCLSVIKSVRRQEGLIVHKGCVEEIECNLEDLMIKSLDIASNEKEVRYLLHGDEETCVTKDEARLGKVIDFADERLKHVLNHSTSQTLLHSGWLGKEARSFRFLRNLGDHSSVLQLFVALLLYFTVLPLTILLPLPSLVRFISIPQIRLHMDFISFWFFLVFGIVSTSYTFTNVLMICQGREKSRELFLLVVYQSIFAAFVVSKIIRLSSCIMFIGVKRVLIGGYDRLQFLSILLYTLGNILILISAVVVPYHKDVKDICQSILNVPNITKLGKDCGVSDNIYSHAKGLPQDIAALRQPYLIGSVFLTCGHLAYFVSAGHVLYMIDAIAMFTIAVQKMIVDVVKWGIFFLIFLFGWGIALQMLYSGYRCANDKFSDLEKSLAEVFWIVFAMTGTTDYKMKLYPGEWNIWSRQLVQYLGSIMYVTFFIVGTLILVNLLIALMSVTYQNIEDDRVKEICYWQSKVRIKYILWKDNLPVPFNLLYPVYIFNMIIWQTLTNRAMLRSFFRCGNYEHDEGMEEEETIFLKEKQNEIFYKLDDETPNSNSYSKDSSSASIRL